MSSLEILRTRARMRTALPDPLARKAIRLASGASLRDLGTAVGVSAEAIRLYEAGLRYPRGRNLEQYARVLDELRKELA